MLVQDVNTAYDPLTSNETFSSEADCDQFRKEDGSVGSGTPNVSSTWNAAAKWYEITIAGETYDYQNYVTLVTPTYYKQRIAGSGSGAGKLFIGFQRLSDGADVPCPFHFVVFKP